MTHPLAVLAADSRHAGRHFPRRRWETVAGHCPEGCSVTPLSQGILKDRDTDRIQSSVHSKDCRAAVAFAHDGLGVGFQSCNGVEQEKKGTEK